MRVEKFVVDRGGRLDAVLARTYPDASRSWWKTRIAGGKVKVDGAIRSADFALKGGETVVVERPEAAWTVDLEARVLFEDKHLLALDKPAGLIVHPLGETWLSKPEAALSEPEPSLGAWLYQARPANRRLPRLGIVHRLDRETSGVLVVAKTKAAYGTLLERFREREAEKRYRAIVFGRMEKKGLRVDSPVGRPVGRGRVETDPMGRPAVTEVSVLKTAPAFSLVEARPLTGRTHQIRIHLAASGHSVLGDPEWTTPELARALADSGVAPPRLMLHAWRLTLKHPATGKSFKAEARVPADFSGCWKRAAAAKAS